MKAITCTYKGPTNSTGSRIVASDGDGHRVTISYPHELSGEAVYRKAADALCAKMGWTDNKMVGGRQKNGVMVFCFVPKTLKEMQTQINASSPTLEPFIHICLDCKSEMECGACMRCTACCTCSGIKSGIDTRIEEY